MRCYVLVPAPCWTARVIAPLPEAQNLISRSHPLRPVAGCERKDFYVRMVKLLHRGAIVIFQAKTYLTQPADFVPRMRFHLSFAGGMRRAFIG